MPSITHTVNVEFTPSEDAAVALATQLLRMYEDTDANFPELMDCITSVLTRAFDEVVTEFVLAQVTAPSELGPLVRQYFELNS